MIDPILLQKIKKKERKAKKIVKSLKKVRMLYATRSITPLRLISDELLQPALIRGGYGIETLIRRKNGLVVKKYPFGYLLVELFVPEAIDVLEKVKRGYDAERIVKIPKPLKLKGGDDLWHVKRIKTLDGRYVPPVLPDRTPWTGKEIRVGILDTGVGPHHFLNGNIKKKIDLTGEGENDLNGHGTHVAGIVVEICPGVEIYSIKVLNEDGRGTWVEVIEGIMKAIDMKLHVINLSLGGGADCDGGCPICSAVDYAALRGVVPVVAAGNEGPERGTISCPGNAKYSISVGATDKNDNIAEFSSRGPTKDGRTKPDVVAPGVKIYSSYLNESFQYLSGTSMATPVVTALIALILQAGENPEALFSSTIDLHKDPNAQGNGLPNLVLFYERYLALSTLSLRKKSLLPPLTIGGSAIYLLLKLLGL